MSIYGDFANEVARDCFRFVGAAQPGDRSLAATACRSAFRVHDTGTNATVRTGSKGLELEVDVANAGHVQLSFDDILAYDIDLLHSVSFLFEVNRIPPAGCQLAFGVANAFADTVSDVDNITVAALFKQVGGSAALLVETDDTTASTEKNDIASGHNLRAAKQSFVAIDFAADVVAAVPPAKNKTGKSNIHFYASNSHGRLERAAGNESFDMSAYSAGLQPFCILTTDGTDDSNGVVTVKIAQIEVVSKLAA